jgi:hypothetical protein
MDHVQNCDSYIFTNIYILVLTLLRTLKKKKFDLHRILNFFGRISDWSLRFDPVLCSWMKSDWGLMSQLILPTVQANLFRLLTYGWTPSPKPSTHMRNGTRKIRRPTKAYWLLTSWKPLFVLIKSVHWLLFTYTQIRMQCICGGFWQEVVKWMCDRVFLLARFFTCFLTETIQLLWSLQPPKTITCMEISYQLSNAGLSIESVPEFQYWMWRLRPIVGCLMCGWAWWQLYRWVVCCLSWAWTCVRVASRVSWVWCPDVSA